MREESSNEVGVRMGGCYIECVLYCGEERPFGVGEGTKFVKGGGFMTMLLPEVAQMEPGA